MGSNFKVDFLGPARKAFIAILGRLSEGKRLEVFGVMAVVLDRLSRTPFEFGEELYNLKALGMQVRVGILLPLAISFGVDATKRIVIIQSVVDLG